MANDLERAKIHKVFPATLEGSTLVVTPLGDAVGFRDIDINSEMKRILELLDRPDIPHLVIDLGSSTYFGTIIIGALTSFGHKCRTRGGKAVLCNASDEMLEVLRVMKLSDLWPKYTTRRDALESTRRAGA